MSLCGSQAAVLDWDLLTSPGWTAGQPTSTTPVSQSFETDSTHTGTDVTVGLATQTAVWSAGYPVINTYTNGGVGQNALQLRADSEGSTTDTITVTISFTYGNTAFGVKNVSFTLFDVDYRVPSYPGNLKAPISEFPGAPLGKPLQPSDGRQFEFNKAPAPAAPPAAEPAKPAAPAHH